MAPETLTEAEIAGDGVQTAERGESGLDANVAGALSYALGILTGVVFFVVDDRPSVRFHAAQSMLLSAAIIGAFVALSVVNTVVFATLFGDLFLVGTLLWLGLSLVWLALSLGGFVLWAYMLYSTYTGADVHLPVIGDIAENIASK